MIDTILQQTLVNVGLDDKESRVYLVLLEMGEGVVTSIAKKASLKRPIVYHVLDRLMEKGCVGEVVGRNTRTFTATHPKMVLSKIQQATQDLQYVVPLLCKLTQAGTSTPQVEVFEDIHAIRRIYRLFEKEKEVRTISSIQRLKHILPDDIEEWQHRIKDGRVTAAGDMLLADTLEDRVWAKQVSLGDHQEIRFLPKGFLLNMDFCLSRDMLAITSFDPLFIVVIYSRGVTESAGQLFDIAWLQSKN